MIFAFIQDLLTWKTMGIGKLEDRLYHFQHSEHHLNDQSFVISSQVGTNSVISYDIVLTVFSSNSQIPILNLHCNKLNPIICSSINDISTNIDLWHCRLGHISFSKLSILHICACNYI